MAAERARRREALRAETRARLLAALSNIKGIDEVIVFGSLTKPERFTDSSDVDVALESEPQGMTVFQLISLLSESLGRRVDVVLLGECRFAEKIRREGELWMLPA
jgi:predicted nucleotidyltransferase